MFNEYKLSYNAIEVTKNIFYRKGGGIVDLLEVTRKEDNSKVIKSYPTENGCMPRDHWRQRRQFKIADWH